MTNIYAKLKYLLIIVVAGFVWEGCNVINPPEKIPTYIHVDSFIFNKTTLGEGIYTHQITNVWAYYNNEPIGAFDLPATIPIVATGTGKLELSPGITIDGLNDLVGVYPFYTIDTSSFTAQPGKIINYTPHTQYYADIVDTPISYGPAPTFGFYKTYATQFYGMPGVVRLNSDSLRLDNETIGGIFLTAAGDSSIDSSVAFAIPTGTAFIELDYRGDVPFALGLQANIVGVISSDPYYLAGIYPSVGWQKFYLSVADFAAQYPSDNYNLYIRAVLPAGQSSGSVFIANVHRVSF